VGLVKRYFVESGKIEEFFVLVDRDWGGIYYICEKSSKS